MPITFGTVALSGVLSSGYRKLSMLIEHLEARSHELRLAGQQHVSADWVLQEIDRFAMGLGKWLKVAGDEKAAILQHSIGSRKLTERLGWAFKAPFGAVKQLPSRLF